MNLSIVGIITLVIILVVGVTVKLYTKKKLNELDGVDSMFIAEDEDKHTPEKNH